jgi:hypothetical protein
MHDEADHRKQDDDGSDAEIEDGVTGHLIYSLGDEEVEVEDVTPVERETVVDEQGHSEAADEHVQLSGAQGWLDRQYVLALALLNLAGGEGMDDIRMLEADAGLCRMVREAERHGLARKEQIGRASCRERV